MADSWLEFELFLPFCFFFLVGILFRFNTFYCALWENSPGSKKKYVWKKTKAWSSWRFRFGVGLLNEPRSERRLCERNHEKKKQEKSTVVEPADPTGFEFS